jgi:hypothetical protein
VLTKKVAELEDALEGLRADNLKAMEVHGEVDKENAQHCGRQGCPPSPPLSTIHPSPYDHIPIHHTSTHIGRQAPVINSVAMPVWSNAGCVLQRCKGSLPVDKMVEGSSTTVVIRMWGFDEESVTITF